VRFSRGGGGGGSQVTERLLRAEGLCCWQRLGVVDHFPFAFFIKLVQVTHPWGMKANDEKKLINR
jgi:hypothetical protein